MSSVCIIVPSLVLGGAERSAVKLANAAASRGHEVRILCMATADQAVLNEVGCGVKVKVFNRSSSVDPRLLASVVLDLRRHRPTLLVGWSTYANFVAVICGKACSVSRIYLSERNYLPQMMSGTITSPLRRSIVLGLVRWLYPKATMVTANSELSVRFLGRYLRIRKRTTLLPNLFNAELFDSLAREPLNVGALPAAKPLLLAVGRLEHQKGFDVLVDAFAKVRAHEQWHLVIAGSGSEQHALREQSKRENLDDHIHFLGKVSNPFPLYEWADIVIVPSRYEGFPNVPMEAMGMGAAVIVSDCKSGPRELSENGTFAQLVPPEDSDALAAAIISLGRDLPTARALGDAARVHVRERYGELRVWQAYEQALALTSQ